MCACLLLAAREHVIGWYSTGPRLREADLSMHQLMTNYCSNPVLVICEVEVREKSISLEQQQRLRLHQQQHSNSPAGIAGAAVVKKWWCGVNGSSSKPATHCFHLRGESETL
jgi:hypothetical protein